MRDPNLTPEQEAPTLVEALERTLLHRVDLAESTKQVYRGLLSTLPEGTTLADLDPQRIKDWIAVQLEHSSSSTVRVRVAALRAVFADSGYRPNPFLDADIKLPRNLDRKSMPPVTNSDWQLILAATDGAFRQVLLLLEETGLRRSELAALTWDDVDLQERRLSVKVGKSRSARRVLDLSPAALAALVFLETIGANSPCPYNAETVRRKLKQACSRAGCYLYSPHSLRHRRATLWLQEGIPVAEVARRLGHSNVSQTLDTYAHAKL